MKSLTQPAGQGVAATSVGTAQATRMVLEEAVRAAEPRALLVRPRILRRVIAEDRQLVGLAIRLPHRKSYVVGRDALLEIVDLDELGLEPGSPLPERVILLPHPSDAKLDRTPTPELLLQYWRLLLHARIDLELAERVAAGELTEAMVQRRIRRIGGTEFDEVRAVLEKEAFLLPPRDERVAYCEFVAVYWELRCFAQSLLPRYFPAIDDFRPVEAIVAEDVDGHRVFEATRLPGVPDGTARPEPIGPHPLPLSRRERGVALGSSSQRERGVVLGSFSEREREVALASSSQRERGAGAGPLSAGGAEAWVELPPACTPSVRAYRRMVRRAVAAAGRGNVVRSAIWRARAEPYATPDLAAKAHGALKRDVDRLVRRLQVALEIEGEDPHPWQDTLLALARQTPRGIWTAEARLLYDLQKVCLDHERRAYRVDLAGWIASLGRQPIKRPLPAQREAAISKHLRSAMRRVPAVRLTDVARQRLSFLLERATFHAESLLRNRFRPLVARALDEAGLGPGNVPEKVAWKKLVEELLDRVVESGHLTMGDLRDALSRNNLKLADFSWRADGLQGDPLLRADRRLASSLEGVHRRGEFYLRWMQRLSSLAFGTPLGRLVTRYLAVPFGGTFLMVTFLDHLVEKITAEEASPSPTWSVLRILLLGTFLMGVVNVEWFRRGTWSVLTDVCRGVGDLVMASVRWIQGIEWLKRFLRSRLARLAYRFVLKPLAISGVAWLVLPRGAIGGMTSAASGAGLFLAVNLLLNSRLGRRVEDIVVDGLVQAWRRLGIPIFTGLFYLVVDLFRGILEAVERLLYTVDEWLQFRTGETRLTFAAKAVLGPAWLFVNYVVRFCINLLIEPQINPIKHFPVVTVSHKLLLPCIPAFAGLLAQTMERHMAVTVATAIIFGTPGVFGFLVWELKENWRLYAANRTRDLPRAVVGEHGETMTRLLRPGIHSGTVPKLFAKLRRAERRAHAGADRRAAVKRLRAIRRVEMAVRRFVERELLELLGHARPRESYAVMLGPIHLATNRIRILLDRPAAAGRPLEVAVEMRSGWLVARILRPGWTEQLAPAERRVLEAALAGFYKLAGVELISEQLRAALPPPSEFDITGDGLVVDEEDGKTRVLYRLRHEGPIEPQVVRGEPWRTLPTLSPSDLLFSCVPIPWDRWVEFWQNAQSDHAPTSDPIAAARILPRS